MKTSFFTFLLAAPLVLSSCMITSGSWDAPSTFLPSQVSTEQHDITFSLHLRNDLGMDGSFSQKRLRTHIERELMKTGMYRSVKYSPYPLSNHHYEFTVYVHGINPGARMGLGALSGATFMTVPIWFTQEIDVQLDINHHGRKESMMSHQYARTHMWAPFILALPFANNYTATEDTVHRFISYFTNEIKRRKL